ncbi:MAG: putative glycoside hydrolase [Lachnospiraceae bacterium]|nr:putative glycoside hydrolase [Lachnospiraceae bacterium]
MLTSAVIGVIALITAVFLILHPVLKDAFDNSTPGDSDPKPVVEALPKDSSILTNSVKQTDAYDIETVENSEESDLTEEDNEDTDDGNFDLTEWKSSHTPVRGIYLTGPTAGSERFDEILELLDDTELNAVVLDIKSDEGNITFKMEHGTPKDIGACVGYIRDMEGLMQTLKEHEIYTIARIACFKDPILAGAKETCALKTAEGVNVTDGNGLEWVNPCSEEVWEYLIEIAEYCADLGFDEIQYDYVRFPVGDTAENADFGMELTPADKHIYIEDFLKTASERLHSRGVPVTADVFGTVIGNEVDVEMVGQDYVELASCVDALCPMVYPSHYGNNVFGIPVPDAKPYDTVYAALMMSVDELKDVSEDERAIVRPWLQSFTATWIGGHISYGPKQIREQIKAVEDAGYDEWILWNAKNNYPHIDMEDEEP